MPSAGTSGKCHKFLFNVIHTKNDDISVIATDNRSTSASTLAMTTLGVLLFS
jgi:hypothetical protein